MSSHQVKDMRFLPAMTSDRVNDAFCMDALQFAQAYHTHINDAEWTILESMQGDTMVRPVFDVDSKHDDEPSEATKRGALQVCRNKIADIFSKAPSFQADAQIAISTRHCRVSPDQYKLSFHGFVKGFTMRLMDVRALIQEMGDLNYFDLTIYPKSPQAKQLFTVIGRRKTAGGALPL